MEHLPAETNPERMDALADLLNPALPAGAAEVIAQLLFTTGDGLLKTVAERISRRHAFVLCVDRPESGEVLVDALPAHRFSPIKREPPNPAQFVQLDPNTVGEWFRPGGVFSRVVPGYEHREEQALMAVAVADAFSSQRHLVVEAGTGVGKTMAYLVPAVLWTLANKIPVVISTNTKNLQNQIYHKDLPVIARIIQTPLKTALIKGRSNYICLTRLTHLLRHRESELTEAQLLPLAHVCAWLFSTRSGDLVELAQAQAVADKLASTAEDCRGRKCPHYSRCFLQAARQASLSSDIVITNHSVYFSEPDKPLALPQHAQVVFDEAHNLEEAATRKFVRELTPYTFFTVLRKLHVTSRRQSGGLFGRMRAALLENNFMATAGDRDLLFEKLNTAITCVEAARASGRRFLRALADLPPRGEPSMRLRPASLLSPAWQDRVPLLHRLQDDVFALKEEVESLARLFEEGSEAVTGGDFAVVPQLPAPPAAGATGLAQQSRVVDFARELGGAVVTVVDLADTLAFTTAVADSDWVYWISIAKGAADHGSLGGLHAAPIEIAGFLAESLFAKKESVVLCSATMNVGGSPAFISHRIGLDRVDPDRVFSRSVGSPFDYPRQCLAAVPMFLPAVAGGGSRAEGAYSDAFSDFTAALAGVTRGRMLVLFTSYRMMRSCAERMKVPLESIGVRLLVQGEGQTRERITRLFREDRPSVLMGTDSFWEGVDLIGETLSCVVIARLPFDAVADPIVSARSERVAEHGGDSFRDFALPNAVIQFRQGFGRLIRHHADRGLVVVADQRILTKNYGGSFRRSLPAEMVAYAHATALLQDAARFLGA